MVVLLVALAFARPPALTPAPRVASDWPLSYLGDTLADADVADLVASAHLKRAPKDESDGHWDSRLAAGGLCLALDKSRDPAGLVTRITFSHGVASHECPAGDYEGPMPLGIEFGITREAAEARFGRAWLADTVAYGDVLTSTWMTEGGPMIELSFSDDGLVAVSLEEAGDGLRELVRQQGDAGLFLIPGVAAPARAAPPPEPVVAQAPVEPPAAPPMPSADNTKRDADLVELNRFLMPASGKCDGKLESIGVLDQPTWINFRCEGRDYAYILYSDATTGLSSALIGKTMTITWGANAQAPAGTPPYWFKLEDPAAPPSPAFSLLSALSDEQSNAPYVPSTQSDTSGVDYSHPARNFTDPFCASLFTLVDDYGYLFANTKGALAPAGADAASYVVRTPIPGFEKQFIVSNTFWTSTNNYLGTLRANVPLDEATRVFEDLTARILVCTGTSKAPTTERRFIGTRLTQEPLPTFNWWLLGVDDYHSLYAHDHFEMRAQVVRAAGDTSGQRYAVTLTMQPRASDR